MGLVSLVVKNKGTSNNTKNFASLAQPLASFAVKSSFLTAKDAKETQGTQKSFILLEVLYLSCFNRMSYIAAPIRLTASIVST